MDPTGIVLLKLGLSDIPGDIIAAKLKQMPKTMDVPVILYTTYSERLNASVTDRICENAGVKEVVKTDDPYVLLSKVEEIIKGSVGV